MLNAPAAFISSSSIYWDYQFITFRNTHPIQIHLLCKLRSEISDGGHGDSSNIKEQVQFVIRTETETILINFF